MLIFCPYVGHALLDGSISSAKKDSLFAVMEQRFEQYKEHVVKKFYTTHFARFDRQIVLVDCLKSLNNGYESFVDMQEAITFILKNFNYGKSSFLQRFISPKIDKLLFAATKADHVTPGQHNNMQVFLKRMVAAAHNDIHYEGIKTECISMAAIRSTESFIADYQGLRIPCLKGIGKKEGKTIALFPGEVPIEMPNVDDWKQERFSFTDFNPQPQPLIQTKAMPHIRMDHALEFLLGDKF